MTGEKDRYSTQEKLWKLDDDTLKTPRHDSMVLDLLSQNTILALIPEIRECLGFNDYVVVFNKGKYTSAINRILLSDEEYDAGVRGECFPVKDLTAITDDSIKRAVDKISSLYQLDIDPRDIDSRKEEEAIKRGRDALSVGTMKILSEIRRILGEIDLGHTMSVESEVPISTQNRFIVGYWDVVFRYRFNPFELFPKQRIGVLTRDKYESITLFIEVKPTISSFGATLRQLRTYQTYVPSSIGNTYLYTLDNRFDEAFKGQGIVVIHPGG